MVWGSRKVLHPLSLVCVMSALSVADWDDPARSVMCWRTTTLLFPFLLDCRTVHLVLPGLSVVSASQLAEFVVVEVSSGFRTLDCTMRHSLSPRIWASSAGRQSKMFATGDDP